MLRRERGGGIPTIYLCYTMSLYIYYIIFVEYEKLEKKPKRARLGYKLETTALISKDNYNAFRIRCIMLMLGKLKALKT